MNPCRVYARAIREIDKLVSRWKDAVQGNERTYQAHVHGVSIVVNRGRMHREDNDAWLPMREVLT